MGSSRYRRCRPTHDCLRKLLAVGETHVALVRGVPKRPFWFPGREKFSLSRRTRIVLKSLVLLIATALVVGIVYEQLGRRRDRSRFPQIGRSVDIGGRSL